ncbi:MAG TPA: C1 family peptidase [Xanthobacteraceae bacterium]|nr:C1 family peptidase [Xanthobacteraceae bacterium]
MNDIVVSVDLRPSFGQVRNQGQRPTCLAFAASDAHAGLRSGWDPLSCEFAFYHAQRRAGRAANKGALLSAMLHTLREDGQPREAGWPYLPTTPRDSASWVPPAAVGPLFGRDGEKTTASIDNIVHELNVGWPMIVLLLLSRAFYQPGPNGLIHPAPGEVPEPQRRHAVIAVGHGRVGVHRAILVRNSWGERWADSGYGWLTEPFLGPRLFAAAKLTEDVHVSACSATA